MDLKNFSPPPPETIALKVQNNAEASGAGGEGSWGWNKMLMRNTRNLVMNYLQKHPPNPVHANPPPKEDQDHPSKMEPRRDVCYGQ